MRIAHRLRPVLVVGALAVLVLSMLTATGFRPLSVPSTGASPGHVASPAPSVPSHVAPAGAPVASGPGTFFTNTLLPLPAPAVRTCLITPPPKSLCPYAYMLNDTNNPTTNYTSGGVLGVAYTSVTNASPCLGVRNYTQTMVTFVRSINNGATWSAPLTLGEPNCLVASKYPSAWEPALTSLSNGTLVMAYVEYNTSFLVPYLYAYLPPVSQLVVTESYTGGVTWTPPVALNQSSDPSLVGISFPHLRPAITAFGSTIYLSWMTMQLPQFGPSSGSPSEVSMLISTTGGHAWSPVLALTSSPSGSYTNYSNPALIATTGGNVFLAYTSTITYHTMLDSCVPFYLPPFDSDCYYNSKFGGYAEYDALMGGSIQVLNSTDDFTSWNQTQAASIAGSSPYAPNGYSLVGPFGLTAPSLAWNNLYHELYLGYVDLANATNGHGWYPDAFVVTTTNYGTNWTVSVNATRSVFNPNATLGANNTGQTDESQFGVFGLSLAVTPSNTLEMMALLHNSSLCYGPECGYFEEVVTTSSDNATTFAPAYALSGTLNADANAWIGEYGSALAANGHLWFAWAQATCPALPSPCSSYGGTPQPQSQVTISTPFSGVGATATFTAAGLNSSTLWEVDLMGNVRVGSGTTPLVVTGVPTGVNITWTLPGANNTTTLRMYVVGQSVFPTAVLSGNLADTVSYHEYAPFSVWITPGIYANPKLYLPGCQYNYSYPGSYIDEYINCVSTVITPWTPGTTTWVPVGVGVNLGVMTVDILHNYCLNYAINKVYPSVFCVVSITNLSFLSWTGVGPGSVSSSLQNITVTPLGPVNETANFFNTAGCGGYYDSYMGHVYEVPSCGNLTTSLSFQERGLPVGTNWGVSLAGPNGYQHSQFSTTPTTLFQALNLATLYTISAWTIPTANPNQFWVPTVLIGGSIVTPTFTPVIVNYTLESLSNLVFNLTVQENGLPNGATWSFSVATTGTNSTYGTSSPWKALSLEAGQVYNVSAGFLAGTSGEGYAITGVSYGVDTINGTSFENVSLPASLNLTGIANVTFWYAPAWWLTVSATAHGSATPKNEWVLNASGVLLTAT
ncbi:MAG: glycoside hydrolase, partial [Thermoplasmata archaeon]|nr:glycoside hydrolase [Thermoplasmata archaeon]